MAIDQQNVQSLLIGSSFLQLQNVKDACCSFLQERWVTEICSSTGRAALQSDIFLTGCHSCVEFRLHPKNCLGVRQFAETMMCTTLYDSANSFLQQHFVEVSVSDEFLGLRMEEVLELVGCDELNIKAEEQVRCVTPATTRGQQIFLLCSTLARLLLLGCPENLLKVCGKKAPLFVILPLTTYVE